MPKELDVPHWARSMVSNFRTELSLPEAVTDRMIYARLEETRGTDPEFELDRVRDLIEEVARGR
jgi:hypothetical protein